VAPQVEQYERRDKPTTRNLANTKTTGRVVSISQQGDTETQQGTMPTQKGRRTREMSKRALRTEKGGEVPSAEIRLVHVPTVCHHGDAAACIKGASRKLKRNIP
jgi:hypothetical protein